jgi:hydrogenase nickel incorporation protein HypB
MCTTCGCGRSNEDIKIYRPDKEENLYSSEHHHHEHDNSHDIHEHTHANANETHTHTHSHSTLSIEEDILNANNNLAERNRGYFEAKNIFAINLVSSPGSGKTSLLEKTLNQKLFQPISFVIEGDQQTDNDAKRILTTGVSVLQINTGNACHLDSNMIHQALHALSPDENSYLFIENVGNLVCPALFDLGENFRVVIFSVTEGEDKPLKYPYMFNTSQLVIINKIDLIPYLDFDLSIARENILKINPHAQIIELSVKTGEGIEKWLTWLKNRGIIQNHAE